MIHLTDVTLRDGLQMEAPIPTDKKLELYNHLVSCKYSRLEITSLVNPKWVPQFSDAELFLEKLSQTKKGNTEWMVFVPNEKGFERLLPFPVDWVSCFISTSETFNFKNINLKIDETLAILKTLVNRSKSENRKIRIYISTVWGCPYEKDISLEKLKILFKKIADLEPHEIALSDTIGVATPKTVNQILSCFLKYYPVEKTALHFHNTYGHGLSNVMTALGNGINHFDGSSGGVGGCPYAKGATGNIATEEMAYFLNRQGCEVRFEKDAIKKLSDFLKGLSIKTNSHLMEINNKKGEWYGC